MLVRSPCKISKSYHKPFWEKSKGRRKRERNSREREIAESFDGMIKFTYEVPDENSGKLTVLDVAVKVNKQESNRVDYEFYESQPKITE